MPGKTRGIGRLGLAQILSVPLILVATMGVGAQEDTQSGAQAGREAEARFELRNCSKWDLNVRVGLTEFDMTDQQTLAPGADATTGFFTCSEAACVVVYGRTESQCSWAAPNMAPGAYVLKHVHSRMIDQCSYATETLGGGGSQFYYLTLEQGSQC